MKGLTKEEKAFAIDCIARLDAAAQAAGMTSGEFQLACIGVTGSVLNQADNRAFDDVCLTLMEIHKPLTIAVYAKAVE